MRVGFVGSVGYEDIPKTALDYLIYFVTVLLALSIIYILYQICCAKGEEETT